MRSASVQHGRIICATKGGESELCTYKLGVWGPAREHVCAPARMPFTISILFDDSHLGICEEGTRVGAGRARFSESFVVPHLGELVRAPAKRQRLRLREWRTAARV